MLEYVSTCPVPPVPPYPHSSRRSICAAAGAWYYVSPAVILSLPDADLPLLRGCSPLTLTLSLSSLSLALLICIYLYLSGTQSSSSAVMRPPPEAGTSRSTSTCPAGAASSSTAGTTATRHSRTPTCWTWTRTSGLTCLPPSRLRPEQVGSPSLCKHMHRHARHIHGTYMAQPSKLVLSALAFLSVWYRQPYGCGGPHSGAVLHSRVCIAAPLLEP